MWVYSLHNLFPAILLIVSRIKTHNSQSKESHIQNPTYDIYFIAQVYAAFINYYQ